ncbi:MAG TPA: NAD(P)-dependent oxidoreductase [Candidatus Aminicenantes bacterium]|nr:NAD(P)-dependent oxidoreductase [Candidatus Aminicenantes bacterium]HRY66079.1 NAD(P)-dependent oxidoreductase [Candidatus Aminicenantes bacterium]HRZ72872.1 NAD(P)-dependent oxidoreductase [Candidatus Aminicenantes bacterium]
MRVLVTGGTGFLGSHLVEALLEEPGVEVFALVRDPSKPRWLEGVEGVRFVTGGLARPPRLPAGLTCVYHLAGVTKTLRPADYYTVNRDGTANLLRALGDQSRDLRFVHLSSMAAAGPSAPGRGVTEDDPPQPVSPYGESKLQAEAEVLKSGDRFSVVLLRAAAIYGPRDEDFLEFFRWIRRGIRPIMGGRKVLSLLYVRDAVRACLAAGRPGRPSGEIFNLADPRPCGWEDIGRIAGRLLGRRTVPVYVPIWSAYLASLASEGFGRLFGTGQSLANVSKVKQMKPDGWVADVTKARRELGFETIFSLEQGLGETIAWYLWKGLL